MVITVGLVCGGMGAYLLAMVGVLRRREKCPACGAKKLALVSLTRGATWPPMKRRDFESSSPSARKAGCDRPEDTSLHRCEACGLEACRAGDGPLIPKHAWDAGQREPVAIPTATVVRE